MKDGLILILMLFLIVGCSTENPLCTDSFCLLSRDDVSGDVIEVDESKVLALIGKTAETVPPADPVIETTPGDTQQSFAFQPVEISGRLDWDFVNDDWQYTENGFDYLKKFILEIETDAGETGQNRILLVHLDPHAVIRDANFKEYIEIFGQKRVKLTEQIGVGEYMGVIIGVPTK